MSPLAVHDRYMVAMYGLHIYIMLPFSVGGLLFEVGPAAGRG